MKKRKSNGQIKINPKVKAIAFKEVKKYEPLPDVVYEKAKSPMKAIRNKCLYCCEGSYSLVKSCPSGGFEECDTFSKPKYRSEKCKACKADNSELYARCKAFSLGKLVLCQLWPFRLGKNPFRTKEISEEHKAKLVEAARKAREARKEKQ